MEKKRIKSVLKIVLVVFIVLFLIFLIITRDSKLSFSISLLLSSVLLLGAGIWNIILIPLKIKIDKKKRINNY